MYECCVLVGQFESCSNRGQVGLHFAGCVKILKHQLNVQLCMYARNSYSAGGFVYELS